MSYGNRQGKSSGTRKVSAASKAKSGSRSKTAAKKPAAKPKTAAKGQPPPRLNDGQRSLLSGIIILFVTAVLTLSLLSPNQGQFTEWLSRLAALVFGIGRVAIPFISGGIGIYLVLRGMEQEPELPYFRLLGFGIVFLVFLAFASLVTYQRNPVYADLYAVAAAGKGGGYVGSLIATALARLLGDLGTIITLIVIGAGGAVLLSGITREHLGDWLAREPQPSTGAEPEPRAVRINPGREKPPAATPQESPQLRLIPEDERDRTQEREHPARREAEQTAGAREAQEGPDGSSGAHLPGGRCRDGGRGSGRRACVDTAARSGRSRIGHRHRRE